MRLAKASKKILDIEVAHWTNHKMLSAGLIAFVAMKTKRRRN